MTPVTASDGAETKRGDQTVGVRRGSDTPREPQASRADQQKKLEQSTSSSRPVRLKFSSEGGDEGHVQVSVLGRQVRARIVARDRATATKLRSNVDELHSALVRRGFSESDVVIRSPRASGTKSGGRVGTDKVSRRTEATAGQGKEPSVQPAGEHDDQTDALDWEDQRR